MVDSIAEYLGVVDSNGNDWWFNADRRIIGAIIVPILSDYFRKRNYFS